LYDARVQIEVRRYSHPDAVELTARVQQEYVVRYGDEDVTPVDPAEFDPPLGLFLVGYLDGRPVATGGWRAQDASPEGFRDGDAEIKRMYVSPDARGAGHARRILAELEDSARRAGRTRMVLESGYKQPEALALYRSSGYSDVAKFGVYRFHELSVCLGKPL
jgi:GNAT superfamily N-acetyltransferase